MQCVYRSSPYRRATFLYCNFFGIESYDIAAFLKPINKFIVKLCGSSSEALFGFGYSALLPFFCPVFNSLDCVYSIPRCLTCVCLFHLSLQQLNALIDRKSGKKVAQKPRFVKQDQVVLAVLQTAGVICLETFKQFPQMARFTLRDEGTCLAFGSFILPSMSVIGGKHCTEGNCSLEVSQSEVYLYIFFISNLLVFTAV